MSISTLSLSLLITVRLLMPPGICVCTLSAPASRMLLALFAQEVPPPAPVADEDDQNHHPGCPASFLAVGMGVAPPSGPGFIDLPLTGTTPNAIAPTITFPGHIVPFPCDALDSGAPLYEAHCALLV